MCIYFEVGERWRCVVDKTTGDVQAYEKLPQHRQMKTNVNSFVNLFPYEDKDFIILMARNVLWSKGLIDRRNLPSFNGTI